MTEMRELFDKATAQVGAYAPISNDGRFIGRVVFKYPRDGAGRLYCYLQAWGAPMARGFASGGGYDKRTAAFEAAAAALPNGEGASSQAWATICTLKDAGAQADGMRWDSRLERRGITVACVID